MQGHEQGSSADPRSSGALWGWQVAPQSSLADRSQQESEPVLPSQPAAPHAPLPASQDEQPEAERSAAAVRHSQRHAQALPPMVHRATDANAKHTAKRWSRLFSTSESSYNRNERLLGRTED